jgi:uncharacterized protein
MSILMAFALLIWQMAATIDEPEPEQLGNVRFLHNGYQRDINLTVVPNSEFIFSRVVKQTYDYSCGSAALTTLLNQSLQQGYTELEVMEGLLRYGEAENIAARRAFSLLDMKKFLAAADYKSAGFKGELQDLIDLKQPAIVPIEYAGFKHFVVVKYVADGRFFIADPAFGNISFQYHQFESIWADNVLFLVYPKSMAKDAEQESPSPGFELSEHDLRYISEQEFRHLSRSELETAPLVSQQFLRGLQANTQILDIR